MKDKTIRYILPFIALLLVTGCSKIDDLINPKGPFPCTYRDPKEVQQLFLKCLDHTKVNRDVHYNDTNEMVEQCKYSALSVSTEYQGTRLDYGYVCQKAGF
jgi:hypothetical protein